MELPGAGVSSSSMGVVHAAPVPWHQGCAHNGPGARVQERARLCPRDGLTRSSPTLAVHFMSRGHIDQAAVGIPGG